jgi:hypothetical protein
MYSYHLCRSSSKRKTLQYATNHLCRRSIHSMYIVTQTINSSIARPCNYMLVFLSDDGDDDDYYYYYY